MRGYYMQAQDTKLIETLEQIAMNLEHQKHLISKEYVYDFYSKLNNVKQYLNEIKQTGRVLRIGIVGEVKAGKSSFLNALIFNGEQILPKAPTPMTAALTKIGYSEKPYAKIVFYKDYDWDIISKNAKECEALLNQIYQEEMKNSIQTGFVIRRLSMPEIAEKYKDQVPTSLYSCYELVQMAEDAHISLTDYLGQEKQIQGESLKEFIEQLNNYVGANGTFTPIVKHTEININVPMLKDIEIIDTPGLNDPIVSRSDKTKEFLMNCDAVFLLSYAGQFLGSEDIGFITQTLPQEGIEKVYLIGSKFDSGILDFKKRKATFKEAFISTRANLQNQAKKNIEDVLNSNIHVPNVIHKIYESLPPFFVSSMLYFAAKHKEQGEPLSEEEQWIVEQLLKRFEGFQTDISFLYELSNVVNVRKKTFTQLRNEKEQVIQQRIENLTITQKNKFLSILENINITARQNLVDLSQYDFKQLEDKLKHLKQKLSSIRSEVKSLFETSNIKAQQILKSLVVDVEKEIDNHLGITTSIRQETHRRTERTGLFGLKKEIYNDVVTIYTANVQEAISGIRKYITRTKELVNNEFSKLFNIDELKRNLKNAVIGAFDTSDTNFNENDILLPVEIILGKLTIPQIEIDGSVYDEEIIRKFSTGVVEGNDISKLMLEQERLLSKIAKDMEKLLNAKAQEMENILLEQASIFVDNIEKQITQNVEMLQRLLKDKEKSIKEYETLIEEITRFKTEIREV